MSNSATKVETTIAELVAAFPAAFTLDPTLVRPVKLGIKDDLYAQCAISRRRITAALRSYCNSEQYLRASAEGAPRIDLAGEPADTVTATEARHATEGLAKLAAKQAGKVASSPREPKTPEGARTGNPSRPPPTIARIGSDTGKPTAEPATLGPKRLSLSDLKRAAAARKTVR